VSTLRGLRYSWVILGTAFTIHFFGGGARFAFGLMLKPMADDLEWNRTTVSLLVTTFMLVSALAMPLAGRVADRYSLKGLLAAGVAAGGVGLGLMRSVTAPWQAFALYGVVNGLGNAGASNPTIGVMVSRWFRERTGTAVSVAGSGSSVGQLVIIAALASAMSSLGWRNAFGVLGAANLLVVLPLVIVAVRSRPPAADPADRRGTGTGETASDPQPRSHPGRAVAVPAAGPADLIRSRELLLLIAVYAICGFQDFFVVTHVVAFAEDAGIGAALAGNILALMGLLGLIGIILSGLMADAFGASRPTALCFITRIAIFASVIYFQQTPGILFFALGYGFTFMITAPLTVVFTQNIFGTEHLGLISSLLSMVHQIAGGLGAVFGAAVFDLWSSYDRAFIVMLGLAALGTASTMAIRERPAFEAAPVR
jgi:predicted MFS family arabinose efflux permease